MSDTLSELYLKERGGSVSQYHQGLSSGQRLGQAFFNALSALDQERLRGNPYDPFYYDGSYGAFKIEITIDYLLETEDSIDVEGILKRIEDSKNEPIREGEEQ